ncbi:hypothetical protein CHS0354_018978 [Potamilus streckersoni]|uniref:Uncharacterized protein n=1 Tax=Potamilus streckersoni TaxID=2493646 RepID=A0AAE0VY62_9BIVA|nr:hypothetical protein CHS0354_018978 [Potamilus streckersoni]
MPGNQGTQGTEFILGFIQKWDVPYDVKLLASSFSVNTSVNVDYFDNQQDQWHNQHRHEGNCS